MRDFLANQVFGLNGLANLSNLAFILAFSVRGVLKLRILSLASEAVILPYYYFRGEPLWPPIFWGVTFIIVNGVQIVILVLERRPVVLSDKEQELYRLAFGSIDKRDFLRLVSLARWVDCSPDEVILKKGQQTSDAFVLISGEIECVLNGKPILAYRSGQLIGDVVAYSGLAFPADVVARGPARLAAWDLGQIREFTESRPKLRAKLLQIQRADLAAKARELADKLSHATKVYETPLAMSVAEVGIRQGRDRPHILLTLTDGYKLDIPLTQDTANRLALVLEPFRSHP